MPIYINGIDSASNGINIDNANAELKFTEDFTLEQATDNLRGALDFASVTKNPLLKIEFSEAELQKMGKTMSGKFSREARYEREGFLPFITSALLDKGHALDNIVDFEKASEEEKEAIRKDLREVYNKVMELNDPEKHDEALTWCDETFVRGMKKQHEYFDEHGTYEKRKDPKELFSKANGFLRATLLCGSANYLEDVKCRERLPEVEKRLNLSHKDDYFRVGEAYSKREGEMESLSVVQYTSSYEALCGKTSECNPSSIIKDICRTMGAKNGFFASSVDFSAITTMIPSMVFGSEISDIERDTNKRQFEFRSFLYDCVSKGKYLSGVTFDFDTMSYSLPFDTEVFFNSFEKFAKSNRKELGQKWAENSNLAVREAIEKDNEIGELALLTQQGSKAAPKMSKADEKISELFGEYFEQLKLTTELDPQTQKPVGRGEEFNKMYDAIEALANYKDGSGQKMKDLLENANKSADNYVKTHDAFIKWTKGGRDRLEFARNLSTFSKGLGTEYDKVSVKLQSKYQELQNKSKEQDKSISEELKQGKDKEPQSKKPLEKTSEKDKKQEGLETH